MASLLHYHPVTSFELSAAFSMPFSNRLRNDSLVARTVSSNNQTFLHGTRKNRRIPCIQTADDSFQAALRKAYTAQNESRSVILVRSGTTTCHTSVGSCVTLHHVPCSWNQPSSFRAFNDSEGGQFHLSDKLLTALAKNGFVKEL